MPKITKHFILHNRLWSYTCEVWRLLPRNTVQTWKLRFLCNNVMEPTEISMKIFDIFTPIPNLNHIFQHQHSLPFSLSFRNCMCTATKQVKLETLTTSYNDIILIFIVWGTVIVVHAYSITTNTIFLNNYLFYLHIVKIHPTKIITNCFILFLILKDVKCNFRIWLRMKIIFLRNSN